MASKTYSTDWKSKKATKAAVDKFEADFLKRNGATSLTPNDAYETVSTGSLNLDYALTIGGVPTGRVIEVWGPEHAGKTTLAMIMVREYQRAYPDKKVAWVDMEQTFDVKWATALGVDVKALWRPPVATAEEVADYTKQFVESGYCSLVVLDSIGGMIARMEYQKEADEATVGLVPKIVTRMVKQVSPMAKANDTTVCVINQVRAQIGSYGPDETTGGGWALKHVTTMKIQVRRGETRKIRIKGQDRPVGHQMMCRIQKNKMGPHGHVAQVWLHNVETDQYGPIGVDIVQETYDFAKDMRLFGTKGGGYHLMPDGETEIRGGDKAVEALRERPDWVEILRTKVLASLADKVVEEEPSTDEDFSAGMRGA